MTSTLVSTQMPLLNNFAAAAPCSSSLGGSTGVSVASDTDSQQSPTNAAIGGSTSALQPKVESPPVEAQDLSFTKTSAVDSPQKSYCAACQLGFGSTSLLQMHIQSVHENSNALNTFPSSDEPALSEFVTAANSFDLQTAAALQQFQRAQFGEQPRKVFNPDAYCELCQKEFCNKYYLATHKATKHPPSQDSNNNLHGQSIMNGVGNPFDFGNPSAAPTLSSAISLDSPALLMALQQQMANNNNNHDGLKDGNFPPMPPLLNALSPALAAALLRQQLSTNNGNTLVGEPTVEPVTMPVMSDEFTCAICQQPCLSQFALQVHLVSTHGSGAHNPALLLNNAVTQNGGCTSANGSVKTEEEETEGTIPSLTQPIRPETYCELCNKEFSSTAYLRSHKMSRHGIILTGEGGRKRSDTISPTMAVGVNNDSPLSKMPRFDDNMLV